MNLSGQPHIHQESFSCVVESIVANNPENGWTIVRVQPIDGRVTEPQKVILYQASVHPGATLDLKGRWTVHKTFGRQFEAAEAIERKPANTAALEKYLGSGLITGVGPKTASRIVEHFGDRTLDVFEESIEQLVAVPGIAQKKLAQIKEAWEKHRTIRDVMIFLQSHGISPLYAVKIFKQYGDKAIQMVSENPYRLASDIYGVGFLTADRVALSIGFAPDSPKRIMAAIQHKLTASRDFGHCYLTGEQIHAQTTELLGFDTETTVPCMLEEMISTKQIMMRMLLTPGGTTGTACYYSRTVYFEEVLVAKRIKALSGHLPMDADRVAGWIDRYCQKKQIPLSDEQKASVKGIVGQGFSVLTGGPGCGKTTTTLVLVKLLEAMGRKVLFAAPTGRAAQRMSEVIGQEATTIHRLLGWRGGGFERNADNPLEANFLVIDESSMLDISLAAALLASVSNGCQVLLIGDADQIPSVGAGNVLKDIIESRAVLVFYLTQIFRQAQQSKIIGYAHQINAGITPEVVSPFHDTTAWQQGVDCLFLDTEEASKEQLTFVNRVKRRVPVASEDNLFEFGADNGRSPYEPSFTVPKKFQHVDIDAVIQAGGNEIAELKAVLKEVHPWSSLHYGMSAIEVIKNLYTQWIPKYCGPSEVQILSPMTRGTLGTGNLNRVIQETANPAREHKGQIRFGERIFREGDRVIHRRNNYDLGVFNGDIGVIEKVNPEEMTCRISFFPDSRVVQYEKDHLLELDLAYAITIHKSQGSEFGVVILPVFTQHYKMLYRNLIYTGLTRAKKMAIFAGSRKALTMAVRQQDTSQRQTALQVLLKEGRA